MAGDIKLQYGSAAALTMTGIEDVDSSSTWIGGWSSGEINNTTDEYVDILIGGQFTMESTNRNTTQPVYTYVYVYACFDNGTTWPDLFSSGTEGSVGAATVHDTEQRDSGMRLLAAINDDGGNSEVYTFPPTSVAQLFGGVLPGKFAIWVTSNGGTTTADWCVSSGTTLYKIPVHYQYT